MTTSSQYVVTGAAGRLGWAITQEAVSSGCKVIGIDRRPAPADLPSAVTWYECDINRPQPLSEIVSDADAVIHTAGFPFPTLADPEVIFSTNTQATYAVLQACSDNAVPRVVVASSGSIFGLRWAPESATPHPSYLPIDEHYPIAPTDCYALSKQVDEATCAMFSRRTDLSVVALRFPGIAPHAELQARAASVAKDPAAGARTLWAYLELRDAATAFIAAARAADIAFDVVGVAAADTLSTIPTAELVHRFHPETLMRGSINGCETTWDLSKAEGLLDWRPQHSWRHSDAAGRRGGE